MERRAGNAHARDLRLVAFGLALLFLSSLGAVWSTPAEAKDWTPQIKVTRRAQIYWESLMRAADADIRALRKEVRQAQRKLKKTRANQEQAVERRVAAKRKLRESKAGLKVAREELKAATEVELPPPDPAVAMLTLMLPLPATPLTTVPALAQVEPPDTAASTAAEPELAATEPEAQTRKVAKLERQLKKAKRDFKKARRKARRVTRNTRSVRGRIAALKASERGAIARRESAERNLGAWVLAMTKFGRIRAAKKKAVRPGRNSAFSWPVRGRLSQSYHAGHDGLDIVSYHGAPIRSAAFGVVTYVGWNPWDKEGRAFMVVVAHAGGYETLYGHLLPRRAVRVGEEVGKGTVIGYMGSTGKSTGTHLHLELRKGRKTLNPARFL
jgi:murein DD-endopeptidase MepM/ murein hydrolase activator NlpD